MGQCGHCKPVPRGLCASVYTTRGGSVFHRSESCEALHDGQRRAARFGREVHTPERVPVADAMARGRGACIRCFPGYRPTVDTRPCLVRVGRQWVRGLLTEWRRSADGRWSGVVSYVVDGEQTTAVKGQDDLRPAPTGS
ncbi:hypothetical protein GCM10010430_21430 [Kitasatospora cystarginea]|uniref:Uncharacterized protein n=1 Tax=Kitasatospora cystarginea TaxID=58350 RepID=A0ABP5QLQ4_9ACTN